MLAHVQKKFFNLTQNEGIYASLRVYRSYSENNEHFLTFKFSFRKA